MPAELEKAKPRMMAELDRSKGVFSSRELDQLVRSSRREWGLGDNTTAKKVIEFLQSKGKLRKMTFRVKHYSRFVRYVWGEMSPYRLAVSLWKGAYLTHGSAVFFHGLTDELPKVIYVNREQSEKQRPEGVLTQERLDMAFSRTQRTSSYVFPLGDLKVALLSGKQTGRLEVAEIPDPEGEGMIPVTKLERTLIDIAVRPAYAGGIVHVLDAFRGARGRVRVPVIVATLRNLDYVYPYHQAVGFLLERAGFEQSKLEPLRAMGLDHDFYLVHGMRTKDYNPRWRLFFPKGL